MTHRLDEIAQCPIELIWHENKSAYLSVFKKMGTLQLRVHRLFYDAPTPVLEALIRYAKTKDPASRTVIKQMAHLYFSQHPIEGAPLSAKGKAYDLQKVFDRMLEILPKGAFQGVSIGWSRNKKMGNCSVTFGKFDPYRHQIQINAILDDPEVPPYFLEYIVYHEMLHAIFPLQIGAKGRSLIHTKEFREKERLFPHYLLAKEWEKKSFPFLRKKYGRA